MKPNSQDWIAGDWGGTHLRLWHIAADGSLQKTVTKAVGARPGTNFAAVLNDLLVAWGCQNLPLVLCGMVGARQGWLEAPYLDLKPALAPSEKPVPAAPDPLPQHHHVQQLALALGRLAVSPQQHCWIVPGLSQTSPANVMRGEETQLLGFLSKHPDYSGYVVLPGTHAKWVRLQKGAIESFSTAMTGELFALLRQHSSLHIALEQDAPLGEMGKDNGLDELAFNAAVLGAQRHSETIFHRLFELRADFLLQQTLPATARGRLSGWLIGLELAGMPGLEQATVTVIGSHDLCAHYRNALAQSGDPARIKVVDGAEAVLQGLSLIYAQKGFET